MMDEPAPDATRPPPLDGVRVLDLTRVLAGPWSTMVLADLGADVIKVESPHGGDDTRHWGPPWLAGESAYYLAANRSKRSIAIDLATPEGQGIVRDLAARADILVENYKLGGLDRFGLGWPAMHAANPRLIYCSISGYGRASPLAARAGYDYMIQAEAGLMAVTGPVDGPPMKVGVAVADLFTGMAATQAILAALIARDRDGVGQHIDIALYDSQLAMLANVGAAWLATGREPPRYGNGHATIVPYQLFDTADGAIVLAVGNDRQFAAFAALAGRPDLARDPRYATNGARVAHREALIALITPLIAARPTAWWLAELANANVPAGAVRSVGAAIEAPETAARAMVATADHPAAGSLRMIASPLRLTGTPVRPATAPPLLDQHGDAVLAELGYPPDRIAALRQAGIVGARGDAGAASAS